MRLSDIDRWDREESDRLRPFGQDPVDDYLEAQATDQADRDRAFDHAPARLATTSTTFTPPAGVTAEQPSPRERHAHRYSRCECGATEKGYRHPGHNMRCPRFSRHHETGDIR